MYEDHNPGREARSIAETVARSEAPETAPLLGTMQMAEAALQSPVPRADAETSSCNRALSAYEEARPALGAAPAAPAPSALVSRLGALVKRLRDRG